jgi:hypothetical protein
VYNSGISDQKKGNNPMNPTYFCLVYLLDADDFIYYGIRDNVFYSTREEARIEMRKVCKAMRKELKADYDLKHFSDSRKADRCAFSADERVSFEIEVVEIKGK